MLLIRTEGPHYETFLPFFYLQHTYILAPDNPYLLSSGVELIAKALLLKGFIPAPGRRHSLANRGSVEPVEKVMIFVAGGAEPIFHLVSSG